MKLNRNALNVLFYIGKSRVAFTVAADQGGNYGPFDADTTLRYSKKITNNGDAFNMSTGKYIIWGHTNNLCCLFGLSIVELFSMEA